MSSVDRLTIRALRGATAPVELRFDKKPVVLIFGENGTGKSTIADAFDLVCNKKCGSLESYSLGTDSGKYVPSLGAAPAAVSVEVGAGTLKWTASLGKTDVFVTPADPPDAQVLRRKKILALIEEKPKGRFETLKHFLETPLADRAEQALRDAKKEANAALNSSVAALGHAEEQRERLWVAQGKPGASAAAWATSESGKDVVALRAVLATATEVETKMQRVADAVAASDAAKAALMTAREAEKQAATNLLAKETAATGQSADLVRLLDEAYGYVNKHASDACPVCESPVVSKALATRLRDRVGKMKDLSTAASALESAKTSVANRASQAEQARTQLCTFTRELATAAGACISPPLAPLLAQLSSFADFLGTKTSTDADESRAHDFWAAAKLYRSALKQTLTDDQESLTLHDAIVAAVKSIDRHKDDADAANRLKASLETALEIVESTRKAYINEVLVAISAEVQTLYEALHPGEAIGKPNFHMKEKAIGSLEFDAQFHSEPSVPPQAYYSESHLDTLGICVFLALAKRFKTARTVVVLDDVLTSVDAGHLTRFMTLLHQEAKQFDLVVVLTHYRPWRDQYRWAKGAAANTQVIELGPWTLKNGVNVVEFLSDLDALRKALQPTAFDRQVVASKAGIALESLLDFITLKYRCKLPRNVRNEHTLGDLVAGIDGKLAAALKCRVTSTTGTKDVALKPLIDAATSFTWVRNTVGCHFSLAGSAISDGDVKALGTAVIALGEALVCPTCKTLPTKRPSGSFWQCACKTSPRELHPLVAPGADPSTVDDEA